MGVDVDSNGEEGVIMPYAGRFPKDQLSNVAEDIADFFGAEELAEPGEKIIVGPPIEVWVASMIDEPRSLREVARWTERFHHQVVGVSGTPLGYALTSLDSAEPPSAFVCKVSGSADVARAFEDALHVLRDHKAQDFVRLLAVPELQLEALWALDPSTKAPEGELCVARVPVELHLERLQIVTEDELVQALRTGSPQAGMLNIDEVLVERSLGELLPVGLGDESSLNDASPTVWGSVRRTWEAA